MGAPTEARRQQAANAAARHDLDPDALFRAANAVWSNLNPQTVNFDRALSVAIVALRAAKEVPA